MRELKKYSLTQFKQAFGITKHVWETRQNDLLEHLNKYFDFEILHEGRYTYINLIKQYAEYEPLPSKRDAEKMRAYYKEEVSRIVKIEPWNTGSCIARNILNENKQLYNHKEDTIARYVRPIIRTKFIPDNCQSQWMRLSEDKLHYIPLTPEELDYWQGISGSKEGAIRRREIIGEFRSGYITREELKAQLMGLEELNYQEALFLFREKFGYMPQYVKYLEEGAFVLEDVILQ